MRHKSHQPGAGGLDGYLASNGTFGGGVTLRLFMSYRRNDSPDVAGRIHDRLVEQFSAENVYYDVDSIPLGVDFRHRIDSMVRECDVVLVVIGPHWLRATKRGESRLDDPRDFVRVEVESALRRDIRVVPVLVHGADIPSPEELPESVRELSFRHGLPVRQDPDFHGDMNRLIKSLTTGASPSPTPAEPTPPPPSPPLPPPRVPERTPRLRYQRLALLIGVLVLVAGTGLFVTGVLSTGNGAPQPTGTSSPSAPSPGATPTTTPFPTYAVSQPPIATAASPADLELDASGLLVSLGSGELQRIDPNTHEPIASVDLELESGGHVFATEDGVAVTTNDCRVGFVDSAFAGRDILTVEGQDPPAAPAFGPEGFWFGCTLDEAYFVSQIVGRAEVRRIDLDWRPFDMQVHGYYLYVILANNDRIGKVDLRNGDVETAHVGDQPVDFAVLSDKLWVTISKSDEVAVVDPGSLEVMARYPVGDEPWKIEAGPDSVWVTNKSTSSAYGTVSRLDPNTGDKLQEDIEVRHQQDELAIGEQAVYVANSGESSISVLTAT